MKRFHAIVTGDVLRPHKCDHSKPHQEENIQRLWSWSKEALEDLPCVEDLTLLAPDRPLSFSEWFQTDDPDVSPDRFIESVKHLDLSSVFVLGFELPINVLTFLENNGIAYVDTCIHPLRFCKEKPKLDLPVSSKELVSVKQFFPWLGDLFGVLTNLVFPERFAVPDEWLFEQARSYAPSETTWDHYLVIGQVEDDRSVLNKGVIARLKDFEPQLLELLNCKPLVYKSHPVYSASMPDPQLPYMMSLGCEITKENTYRMLANPGIAGVIAISSSVLYEARYFGKRAIFLQERPRTARYVPVCIDNLFTREFFYDLFTRSLSPA